ncbi:hypothetical protein CapIbe_001394 [Capra ibex]
MLRKEEKEQTGQERRGATVPKIGDTHTYPSVLAEMLTQITTGVHAAHFHRRVSSSPSKTTTIGKQSCLLLFCLN